jgi:hypothetical protein
MIAAAENIVICFAHVASRLHERWAALGISSFTVRDTEPSHPAETDDSITLDLSISD